MNSLKQIAETEHRSSSDLFFLKKSNLLFHCTLSRHRHPRNSDTLPIIRRAEILKFWQNISKSKTCNNWKHLCGVIPFFSQAYYLNRYWVLLMHFTDHFAQHNFVSLTLHFAQHSIEEFDTTEIFINKVKDTIKIYTLFNKLTLKTLFSPLL